MSSPVRTTPYRPQLDGLRAIAVLFVLLEHFGLTLPALLRFGPLCVRFFFVLSGYFITLSLWKIQAAWQHEGRSDPTRVGDYYLNRLLRIGPPFYLALAVGALAGIVQVRENFAWLATFQVNTYIAWIGYWPESISHFWSLAVQEQFYLLWPLLVLLLPRHRFTGAMIGLILFALVFRLVCIGTEAPTLLRWITLPGSCDLFAIGALVAWAQGAGIMEWLARSPRLAHTALPLVAFAALFLSQALMTLPENNLALGLTESLGGLFLAWLLLAALGGLDNRWGRWLASPPLAYLGRISYGLYVYHVFVIILVGPVLAAHGLGSEAYFYPRLLILSAVSLGLASLSWHLLEQPLLAWKNPLAATRAALRDVRNYASPRPDTALSTR